MLAELSIKNFAIIEQISISFQKGFTVLTGETGAGKSIIIDAISILAGGRGSAEFVRYGEEKAELEGLFLIEEDHPSLQLLKEMGIEGEDGMIVLKRDIYPSGKSVCRINGKLVTISSLREIGRTLVDVHGQHEHQELMDVKNHLSLLDDFGGDEIKEARAEYQSIYKDYVKAKKDLKELSENEREMVQKLDLYRFQFDEISKANLKIGEDEELLAERKKFMNFEKVYNALKNSYEALADEHKGLDWVGLALTNLEECASIDGELTKLYDSVSNSYYLLEEVKNSLRDQLEEMEYDPERINYVEERLNEISQLKRKYGKSIEDILEYAAKLEGEIEIIENRENHILDLEKKVQSLEKDLLIEGENLTKIRKKWAKKLIEAIHHELKSLYMDKTVFEVKFHEHSEHHFTQDGMDEVEFYISTNPGEPLKPLVKIASGGELSRIMLALKTIFSKHQGITSIIFDEVDTGVSGRVAQAIGEKIYQISIGSQVLSITHLPQVAAMSDHHYYISKEVEGDRTKTAVEVLSSASRIREIARMIAGAKITLATEEHAREMIEMAEKYKHQSITI